MNTNVLSRRTFLCASGVLLLGPRLGHAEAEKSTVVEIRTPRLFDGGEPSEEAIRSAISLGVRKAMNEDRAAAAWRRLFTPQDVIGIKFNSVASAALRGNAEIARALVAELSEAGMPEKQILVIEAERVKGTSRENGEADSGVFRACETSLRFKQYVTKQITALIDVPLLKHHSIAGVSLGLKNLSHGTIWNPSHFHRDHCDAAVGEIVSLPPLKSKLRLTIGNALFGLAEEGPYVADAKWVWRPSALLLSTDVVAHDAIGLGMIREQRRAMGLPTLEEAGRPPHHIATAARLGLGISDRSRIRHEILDLP